MLCILFFFGQLLKARRVKVCLEQPNRDGDREIFILTNLSSEVIDALLIAQLDRKRWKLETLFQVLTENFCCQINTLGTPISRFIYLLYRFSRR
ncbi:MAG: hypothetical protein V7L05_32675 [Nostoc sp.]|uniref:hypothetical protein n=1 Tax=Nostoc sp. TaxID=1180 RepID=UPI002FF4F0EA